MSTPATEKLEQEPRKDTTVRQAGRADSELEQYRTLLETPTEFRDGFGWSTVAGIIFCGLVMMPGSIYLGLMVGGQMTAAAVWVTLILFSEIARRALKPMNRQQLVVLLHAAGVMMAGSIMIPGGPFGNLVYRAFFVTSDAVRSSGLSQAFPTWWVPRADSPAITQRLLLHWDWLAPVALMFFMAVIGLVTKYTLGYVFFRLTSDIEQLPFPMAPVQAQGAMALAEADESSSPDEHGDKSLFLRQRKGQRKKSERWRLFSFGAVLGLVFGFLQVGVPAISGLILDKPVYLLPLPWFEATTRTESFLPAVATGLILDLGIVLVGMVIPFWAAIGSFAAIIITVLLNLMLYKQGILARWQPGMDSVNTTFANNIDFYMSFGIGTGLGIAVVSIFQTVRDVRRKLREARQTQSPDGARVDLWATPRKGRGDYPLWIAVALYLLASAAVVGVSIMLLPLNPMLIFFLIFFVFFYSPFISYVNARLLGIAGQSVDIPFVKQTAFILSGARGVEVWLAPMPVENYGGQAQSFRVNELTGVSFWSLIKAELVAVPVLWILSFAFWGFIWKAEAVPSDVFPAAQVHWELASKNDALLYTSTHVAEGQAAGNIKESQFFEAIHGKVIAVGFAFTTVAFAVLSALGAPVLLVYGFVRGVGQLPHAGIPEIAGALIGRFYFQKKFGRQNFLRMAPTVLAGYFTGVGLMAMSTIALKLIKQAISVAPY